jgi:hypothetical protein
MFKKTLRGKIVLNLNSEERALLSDLYRQMSELLSVPDVPADADPLAVLVGLEGPTEISSDPAVARLFPSAYQDDAVASSDFRRFTEPDLRSEKMNNLEIVSELLRGNEEKIELSIDQAKSWLKSLNDLRLVLGTRLGIGEDFSIEDNEDSGLNLYDYLTYLQGTLVDAL